MSSKGQIVIPAELRGDVTITYTKGDGTLELTSTGPINGGVGA